VLKIYGIQVGLLPFSLAYKRNVADSSIALDELLDLKMLPAWANEPGDTKSYAHVEGEEDRERHRHGDDRRPRDRRGLGRKRSTHLRDVTARQAPNFQRATSKAEGPKRKHERGWRSDPAQDRHREDRDEALPQVALQIAARFLPHAPALENVIAQIKQNAVAYSVFALARLFLAKPERYDIRLTSSDESPLLQLGENGAVSVDRPSLERNAFRLAQSDFYRIDITEAEPIKFNFTNVALCKLS
jgi:hypothetical protein